LINPNHASDICRPGDPIQMKAIKANSQYLPMDGGTTTCCIIDKWGNIVAATPSGWGSTAGSSGGTGIVHGTRLRSMNTTPGHPNRIEPGKRPRITLTPTLVFKDDKPILAISVAGGDVQDQTTLNLLLKMIVYDLSPYEAITTPRFATTLHEDSFNPVPLRTSAVSDQRKLIINRGVSEECLHRLKSMGHQVELLGGAIGSPVMIRIYLESGIAEAVSDPKINHFVGAVR
jgi:gamma-glutamyltranspeptidase/glutathione hydrolase